LGVLVGIGLWFIGVPNPVLSGILTMLLCFVPYIGPVIAAAFSAVRAIAVDPGWSMLFSVVGLFVVAEGEHRRRVLDIDPAGGRGAERACSHARRSRRHLVTASGGTDRQCRKKRLPAPISRLKFERPPSHL
jgi:hypothetical protein